MTVANEIETRALVGEKLTSEAFAQLSGNLAGYPFVKVVLDRKTRLVHFINNARYPFHGNYIAENLMGISKQELEERIDEYNRIFYLQPDRPYMLGILALQKQGERFFTLETVEIDNMDAEMVKEFYQTIKALLDPSFPLLFKPANHLQETIVAAISPSELPRVFTHELFASSRFVALNAGTARGRIRAFKNDAEYRKAHHTLEWYDIVVMPRVPDDIPRVAGIINAHHVTPLSHTNVLAAGWKVPNAIQLGIFEQIDREGLDGSWVEYTVSNNGNQVAISRLSGRPDEANQRPGWSIQRIKLEEPETVNTPIVSLETLRMSDRYRYGTKAANLGELHHILENGSERLIGFYKVRRPPRPHLIPYLAQVIGASETATSAELNRAASDYLRAHVRVPRGIAIPFAVQEEFLESSPAIQQAIGKLKMALELSAREIDSLCLSLQSMIRKTRFPEKLRNYIDLQIADHLGGVSSFVIRSSSNAEDLEGFSAAGIYESINHCTSAENVFESIKEVWASLVSPRSVRLRHEVGISLDDCYMGVIVQEEVPASMGGVLVTTNPMNRGGDFRNVYVNVSAKSVAAVVQGDEDMPYQFLYNTVEGGGRTLALGRDAQDLSEERKAKLQILAYAGRILQSHFSPDYTFSTPVDIEWVDSPEGLYILQLRPYSK